MSFELSATGAISSSAPFPISSPKKLLGRLLVRKQLNVFQFHAVNRAARLIGPAMIT
jgi:hypothetical protein